MTILRALDRLWAGLIWLLMAGAAIYVGMIMVLIVYVTVFRTAGWAYTPFANISIEYGFVFILFMGSPWLIRHRGHIYIEILTAMIPEAPRRILSRVIVVACAAVCFLWAWYTLQLFWERWGDEMAFDELRAQFDVRGWIGIAPFPIGFFLMGIEFLRFAVTAETMHAGMAGIASDRIELEEQQRALARERER